MLKFYGYLQTGWPTSSLALTPKENVGPARYRLFAATAAVTAGGSSTAGGDGRCPGRQRKEEGCRKCEYECFEFHNDLL